MVKKSMSPKKLSKIFDELFPILRSITGPGYLQSLKIIGKYIKFKYIKYKSGKKIFDWNIPNEWHFKDGYIENLKGKKIVDVKKNNLHILNFSTSINKKISISELKNHLYTMPNYPQAIPYSTSYYKKNWGFCISYNQQKKLKDKFYKVKIDTKFKKGNLINGVSTIKGNSKKINLITSYLCHPSMANNELSGPLVMLGLYEKIKKWKNHNYTYKFLINPETIGSLCFIFSEKKNLIKNLNTGLVLTCLGGPKKILSYKKSRMGLSNLDRLYTFLSKKKKYDIRDFTPNGSDERQYCSGELNLPVGQISRTIYHQFKEYHTSKDDKKFMNIDQIYRSIEQIYDVIRTNDNIYPLKRYIPFGEYQLGKRDLYYNVNSHSTRNYSSDYLKDKSKQLYILKNILSYADGKNDILSISEKTNISLEELGITLNLCLEKKLIKKFK